VRKGAERKGGAVKRWEEKGLTMPWRYLLKVIPKYPSSNDKCQWNELTQPKEVEPGEGMDIFKGRSKSHPFL
jgi:hypothetical protein